MNKFQDICIQPPNQKSIQTGFTLWFTGLSCSGKTTIADGVARELKEFGLKVERLDGDIIRRSLTKDLGFSKEDRDKNIERVVFVARLLSRNGVATLCSFISPYEQKRLWARNQTTNFIEVYVKCPIDECIRRDVKGTYKKALAGEIKNFTGIDDPYQKPIDPEIILYTDKETPQESIKRVIEELKKMNFVKDVY